MANEWDGKLKGFLKKTGEDFRRAGNDIKDEAQKLMKEVKDPAGQEKIREGLKDFGGWAKKAAVEMAELAETGFKKAEGAFRDAGKNWTPGTPGAPGSEAGGDEPQSTEDSVPDPMPTATPPSAPPDMPGAPPPSTAPKKTIGKKKTAAAAAKPKAAAKKTIGKKST